MGVSADFVPWINAVSRFASAELIVEAGTSTKSACASLLAFFNVEAYMFPQVSNCLLEGVHDPCFCSIS